MYPTRHEDEDREMNGRAITLFPRDYDAVLFDLNGVCERESAKPSSARYSCTSAHKMTVSRTRFCRELLRVGADGVWVI